MLHGQTIRAPPHFLFGRQVRHFQATSEATFQDSEDNNPGTAQHSSTRLPLQIALEISQFRRLITSPSSHSHDLSTSSLNEPETVTFAPTMAAAPGGYSYV